MQKLARIRWGLKDVVWPVFMGILLVHLMAIAALWFFSWSGFALMLILWWISGCFGVVMCYHRLLTHRSFETPRWFEYVLVVCALLSWQGGILTWVGNHRLHHAHSDEEADPHTPRHGSWWAHMIWIFVRRPESGDPLTATKDLQRDPVIVFLNRWFWVPQVVVSVLLFGGGWWYQDLWLGVSWLLWGVGVRTVIVYHVTWRVNSAGHTTGYRNFNTADGSTNNWFLGILSFGEGFHNNHHAQQRSARHGMRWFEIDLGYYTIKILEFVGLATKVVEPDREKLRNALTAAKKTAVTEPLSTKTAA